MSTSLARRLIVGYAVVVALLDLSALVPGNPDFTSFWGFLGAVGIQMLIVWRLWCGSSAAWLVAMALAALTVVSIPLIEPGVEVGVILTFVLSAAQVAILWTRPVLAFVSFRSRPEPLLTKGPPSEPAS
jgi:hypothetical protein